jgi:hypothetical protein
MYIDGKTYNVIVCGLLEWKQICAGSFVYICIAIDNPVIKWESWDPINQFNPATFCDCINFQRHMLWSFSVFSELRGDRSFC